MLKTVERSRVDVEGQTAARALPGQTHDAVEGIGGRRKARFHVQFGLIVAAEIGVALAGFAGFTWWTHGRFVQTTNDAYLRADAVAVAPRVQGYVQAVLVHDNQPVVVGQPLVRIDTASYDAALAEREATVEAGAAEVLTAQRQIVQQRAAVQRVEAELAGAGAAAAYASEEADRIARLSAQGVETAERAAQARSQAQQAASAVRADEAALRQTHGQTGTLQAQVGQARAQLDAARAEARSARISLHDTLILAGVSGTVGDRTVRVGQFVQPGTRLLSLVPVKDIYVVANFKETQLGRIRVGQAASVQVDALGGRPLPASVDSFAPGTGAQFALLPPENATGNFTKIVQRIPVRLRLFAPANARDHLVPGLSATVRIDTSRAGAAHS